MSTCAAARFLRAAGPAAVPLRACCTAAMITAGTPGIQCTAGDGLTEPEPVIAGLGASVSADVPVGAQGTAAAGSDLVGVAAGSDLVGVAAGSVPVGVAAGSVPVGAAADSVPVAAEAGSHVVAAVAGRGDHGAGWPSP
jgi:hypothetical protein